MKLLDLNESRYFDLKKENYTAAVHYYGSDSVLLLDVTVNVDLDLESNFGGVIENVLTTSIEEINKDKDIDEKGYEFVSLNHLMITDFLEGGGSSIVIGKLTDMFSSSGRELVIDIENPTDDILGIVSKMKKLKLPSKQECMTRIKRDHKILKGITRLYDVQDINVELTLLPKVSSVGQLNIRFKEDQDEEQTGFALGRKLQPYKIRPQINGGPVVGTKPL